MKHNTYFSVAPVPVSILHLVLETIERQGWNVAHVAYCGNVQKSSIMTPQKQIFPGFVVIANRWHDGDKRPIPPVFNMEAIEKAASSGESVLPAIATPQSPADPQKPAARILSRIRGPCICIGRYGSAAMRGGRFSGTA